jgi:type IV pilus assembly protein PilF
MDPDCGERLRVKKWHLWWALMTIPVASTAFASTTLHELASLHTQLAVEYARAGQYRMALDSAERAVSSDANFAPAWLARAYVESALSMDDAAERDYQKALRLAPDDAETNNNYGQFLCEKGRAGEAIALFDKALSDPLYGSPQTAYFNLGRCSLKLNRAERAIVYLQDALRVAPDYIPALKSLAALYLDQGSVKLATYYYGRLIQHAGTPEPDDLLLGVRIARLAGDRVREARFAEMLLSRYPDSKETQQLLSGT